MGYNLFAEREGKRRYMATGGSLLVLKSLIDYLEKSKEWPEGSDAVAIKEDTHECYLYTDKWTERTS